MATSFIGYVMTKLNEFLQFSTLFPHRKAISLLSHSDVRYRGILAGLDPSSATIQLRNGLFLIQGL